MSEEKDVRKNEEVQVEEFVDDMLEVNENFAEDFHQEQEEGDMEDIDSQADQIGFESEEQAEKLTLRKLKEYNEAIEKREKVEFYVEFEGQKDLVYVTIEKNFTKTNIVACLQEYIKKLDVLRTKKIELQEGFLEMYLIFQIIKHFTDLDMPKSIENQLVVMERLINTGLIFTIFSEFPKEQVQKVLEEVYSLNENLKDTFVEMEKQMKEMNTDDIENEYIKKQVQEDIAKVMEQNSAQKSEGDIKENEEG